MLALSVATALPVAAQEGNFEDDLWFIEATKADEVRPIIEAVGMSVTVAVIDEGVSITHRDTKGSLWVNPGESGVDSRGRDKATNRVDDDGNGYVDDVHGYDFIRRRGTFRENSHGTATASIIGAPSDGDGLVGTAPGVKIMHLAAAGRTELVDDEAWVAEAIDYARIHGAKVINCSLTVQGKVPLINQAIGRCRRAGVAVAFATGNNNINVDENDPRPTGKYMPKHQDNMIFVSGQSEDGTWLWNHGQWRSHIAAPAENLRAAQIQNDNATYLAEGTSFSTPQVTGALAILANLFPDEEPKDWIERLMASADRSEAFVGRTACGGTLNILEALIADPSRAFNDRPATAVQLASLPGRFGWWSEKATASRHVAPGQGGDLWWKWTSPIDSVATIKSLQIRGVPSIISIFGKDGNRVRRLVTQGSEVSFDVSEGQEFWISLSGIQTRNRLLSASMSLVPPSNARIGRAVPVVLGETYDAWLRYRVWDSKAPEFIVNAGTIPLDENGAFIFPWGRDGIKDIVIDYDPATVHSWWTWTADSSSNMAVRLEPTDARVGAAIFEKGDDGSLLELPVEYNRARTVYDWTAEEGKSYVFSVSIDPIPQLTYRGFNGEEAVEFNKNLASYGDVRFRLVKKR